MALDIAGLSPILNIVFADEGYDDFRRDVALLHLLDAEPTQGAELHYGVKLETRDTGGAVPEGYEPEAADFSTNTRVKARQPWANYATYAQVSDQIREIAGVTGGAYVGTALGDELRDAITQLRTFVGTDLYAGDPSGSPAELAGAGLAVAASGTFAGINPATSGQGSWVGNVDTVAAADLTFDNLRSKLFRPVINSTGRYPDFVMVSSDRYDLLKTKFDEKADTTTQVRTRGGIIDIYAAAGSRAIMLDGVPFIEDRHCTSGALYALSRDYVKIKFIPFFTGDAWAPTGVQAAIEAFAGTYIPENEIAAALARLNGRLQPLFVPLAKTGANVKVMVRAPQMQLEWGRRSAHARLNVTVSE